MTNRTPHVDDAGLRRLVLDDEDGDVGATAAHVEACPECQQRLIGLAATDEFASEASSLLSSYPSIEQTQEHVSQAEATLDFLGKPSHPEMLGRLGRYEIERVIGSGGMGVVLKGFDAELNRPVAVKVLAQHLAHRGASRKRFAREAKAAAAIVHEHVVAIHNVEADGDLPFLVMQYVAGESLQARVDREGPLKTKEVLRIGIQVAAGLAAAHEQGVVHRDIKPANILLENGVERVLITDFGLARIEDDASLTHTGFVAGTPHYMSPEQADGRPTDERTDLFSLGSVLYFMATGRPPFRAERAMGVLNRICHDSQRPAWRVNSEVPDELSDLIDRLLQKRPSRRFGSASEVREALARLLVKLQKRTKPHRTRFASRLRRHRPLALTLLGSVAATVTIIALSLPSQAPDSSAEMTPTPSTDKEATADAGPETVMEPALEAHAVATEANNVERRISAYEAATESSEFSRGADEFAQKVDSMNQRLDRIEFAPLFQRSDSSR